MVCRCVMVRFMPYSSFVHTCKWSNSPMFALAMVTPWLCMATDSNKMLIFSLALHLLSRSAIDFMGHSFKWHGNDINSEDTFGSLWMEILYSVIASNIFIPLIFWHPKTDIGSLHSKRHLTSCSNHCRRNDFRTSELVTCRLCCFPKYVMHGAK